MLVAKSGLRVPGTKFHSFRDSLIIEGARVQCRKQMGEHRRVDVCEHTIIPMKSCLIFVAATLS